MKKLFLLFLIVCTLSSKANNVQLSNVSVTTNVAGTGKVVEFDISWENSWRTTSTNNYDGVWVFFKFKDYDCNWYPLRFTGINNSIAAGFVLEISNNAAVNGVGMFIYRSALGFGTSTIPNVKAGIQSYPGIYEVRGFAIEMVYIPQGSFWVGDGASPSAYQNSNVGNSPYQITGNGASITRGTATGNLYDPTNTIASGNLAGFPTGFQAYWMMKYELSQGAYRDFLNTLTYTQQINRSTAYTMGSFRQYIEIGTPGVNPGTPAVYGCDADNDNILNEPNDGEWVIVNGVSWTDCAAYLDWAGLRPMTEFEYEKACRGPLTPVASEYAWGTNLIAIHAYIFANSLTTSESVTNPSSVYGNALNDSTSNNVSRGGIFATSVSTRISSGAGYYGVMELTGNVSETVVTTSNLAGSSYGGKLGDGLLTTNGTANENFWPGVNGAPGNAASPGLYDGGNGVISDGGIKWRGGYFQNTFDKLKVSERVGVGLGTSTTLLKAPFYGIRGVRDAN